MDKPTYLIQTFYDQYCKVSERNEVMEDFVLFITQKNRTKSTILYQLTAILSKKNWFKTFGGQINPLISERYVEKKTFSQSVETPHKTKIPQNL
jgi:hypothetical protein